MMANLLILGAGGHGRVVAEAAEIGGVWDIISFLDDRTDIASVLKFDIAGKLHDYANFIDKFEYAFVAIGANEKRLQWIDKLLNIGFKVPTIVHPRANVSKYSTIGEGTAVLAGAVVNTNSRVGKGCILNINSCVDHDCEISDGVHISSGAVVRSMVRIGKLSNIGAASCVKAGACLGENFFLPEGKVAEGSMIV